MINYAKVLIHAYSQANQITLEESLSVYLGEVLVDPILLVDPTDKEAALIQSLMADTAGVARWNDNTKWLKGRD